MELKQFIFETFGVWLNNIQRNKYTRFADKNSKSTDISCWVYDFGNMAVCGDWAKDVKYTWRSDEYKQLTSKMNKYELEKYQQKERQRIAEIAKADEKIKFEIIQQTWSSLSTVGTETEYFVRKQVNVQPDFRFLDDGTPVVPMYRMNRQIYGGQRIYSDKKLMLAQSQFGFYPVRKPDNCRIERCEVIFICEGYATAYSLFQLVAMYNPLLKYQVLSTQGVSNILATVEMLRKSVPDLLLIGCADNDKPKKDKITSQMAMQKANIPFFVFDSEVDGWDANDAYCKDKYEALDELSYVLDNMLQGK